MATTQIKIVAEVAQANRALEDLKRQLSGLESNVASNQKAMQSLTNATDLAATAAKTLVAALGIREVVNYTNTWTDLNSRLRNATGSQQEADKALKAISETARKTYQPVQQVADVFLQNNLVLTDLGYTTNEQIKLNTLLNNTLAVSGSRGEKAASAVAAFGKAVGEGRISTETLNSMLNNNTRLVRAMADSLGVNVEQLRKMASEGKLETGPMLELLASQMQKVQKEADAMPAHIGDAMVLINDALLEFVGELDKSLGASTALADGLIYLSKNIDDVIIAAGVMFTVLGAAKFLALAAAVRKTTAAVGALNAILTVVGKNPLIKLLALVAGGATFVGLKIFGDDEVKKSNDLTDDAADRAAKEERSRRAKEKITEEQQKQLKLQQTALGNLDQTISKQGLQLQFLRDQINLGVEEASIRKAIAEEKIKLTNTQLNLSQIEIQNRIKEFEQNLRIEQSLKEQIKLKEQLNKTDEELQKLAEQRAVAQGHAFTELLELDKKIAIQRQALARATTDEERKRINEQTHLYNKAYDDQLEDLMIAHSAEQSAIISHKRKIQQIDSLQEEARLAGFSRESDAYKSLTHQKLRLEEELHIKRLRLQEDRIRHYLSTEKNALNQVLNLQGRTILQEIGKEEKRQAMVEERINFEKKSETEKRMWAVDQAAQMFTALGAQNKKAFEAAKAFNIANAIMNTYMAATKALATYPPPFNFIAAAAAVGLGLAQVAQIRSQQYSGRRVGGPVVGGQSYLVGETGPEIFTPGNSGSITKNSDIGSGSVNVNFTINAVDAAGIDAVLVQRRGLITQIVSDAMVERGQRGI